VFMKYKNIAYPCLCLCLGLAEQTIYTYPLRRTTLHFEHIFLTDAFTRMGFISL
jgi:hypothetical protein